MSLITPNWRDISDTYDARRTTGTQPYSVAERGRKSLPSTLTRAVSLSTPEPSKPHMFFADASALAAGACLAQMGDDGKEKPIAFDSYRFTPTQTRWLTIEREAFAII